MGEMSKLGCLIGWSIRDMWADSLYFLYVMFGSICRRIFLFIIPQDLGNNLSNVWVLVSYMIIAGSKSVLVCVVLSCLFRISYKREYVTKSKIQIRLVQRRLSDTIRLDWVAFNLGLVSYVVWMNMKYL
jgi:hypothetical protein